MVWISPTGHFDDDSKWDYETSAYDDNLGTTANTSLDVEDAWGSYLRLVHDSMICDKIRFYVNGGICDSRTVDLDAFYDGEWHDVYQGIFIADEEDTGLIWAEISFDASHVISQIRLRFYRTLNEGSDFFLYDVQLNEIIILVTTEAATQMSYQCGMGNGTITSGTNATERGFGIFLEFSGTLNNYIEHRIAGFDQGDEASYNISTGNWEGTLTKIETETGNFTEGAFELVLGYPSVLGNPSSVFDDKLFKCEDYLYSAYAIIDGETYTGDWVAFSTLCDSGGDQQPSDDISEGEPTVPIIPIEPEPEPELPPFEWEPEEPEPYPPWEWDIPPYEIPDYPPMSFVGDFYYKKPYTKKDLDDLRKKCIIYNKNSVEFALVLRHNMNVLREFFNMMTDYMSKDEFNDFTDLIPPQRLKELYLDPLEVNDFKDMINGFIRNTIDNNIAVNRNFSLIQEGLSEYETESDDAYFTEISSAMKTVTEDNPDVDTLKIVIDNLNQETASNFSTIMHNLEILRARLL